MFRSKKGKASRKKFFSYAIVFLLVGGLLLGAMAGFFDFLWGGKNLANPIEGDEFARNLKEQADLLEKSYRENPDDLEKKAVLGSIYYELAMYYWGQGQDAEEEENYAEKSMALLLPAAEGGLQEPALTLKIALLAAFIEEDDARAEKYFRETLSMQDDYPEAHFYYGLFLASQDRVTEAKVHWKNVLQQVEEDSSLAREAQLCLEIYAGDDTAGEKEEVQLPEKGAQ